MPSISEINSLAREVFLPRVGINFGSQSVFLKMARAKGDRKGGGTQIVKSVAYQYTKGGSYGRGQEIDISGEQNVTAAKLSWRYYDWPGFITRQDELENSGEGQVHDLLSTKFQVMTMGASEMLSNHIFTGTGLVANDVTPLDEAVDNALGTLTGTYGTAVTSYAGISRTTDSWWAGKVVDIGGASASTTGPTYKAYQRVWSAAHDGDEHPTLVLSHAISFDAFMSSQQPQQQYISSKVDDELTAGFRRTVFNGVPYVADNHVRYDGSTLYPLNRVYMLNMNHWTFWTHEDEDFRFIDWQKPVNQNTKVAHLMWAGNHMATDPRRHVTGYNFKADYVA